MKKIIIVLFIIVLVLLNIKTEKKIIIPEDAIRFRIIANSNTLEDQSTKVNIKNELTPILSNILTGSNNINDTKYLINNNISNISNVIDKYNIKYNINYGMNYFPEKEYKGVTYKEGEYESLVITLGDGLGDNWWCVLFPPLCLLDEENKDMDDYTYSFYIKEIIDKYK